MDRITNLGVRVNIVHNITEQLPRLQMQIGVTRKSAYSREGEKQKRVYELLGQIYDAIVYYDWVEETEEEGEGIDENNISSDR